MMEWFWEQYLADPADGAQPVRLADPRRQPGRPAARRGVRRRVRPAARRGHRLRRRAAGRRRDGRGGCVRTVSCTATCRWAPSPARPARRSPTPSKHSGRDCRPGNSPFAAGRSSGPGSQTRKRRRPAPGTGAGLLSSLRLGKGAPAGRDLVTTVTCGRPRAIGAIRPTFQGNCACKDLGEQARDKLVGVPPVGVVVRRGRDHQLVRGRHLEQLLDAGPDGVGIAD